MSYTAASVVAVAVALTLDLLILRTRLVATRWWWTAYAIVLFFQLMTNGWLTGRLIVTYDPAAIIGSGSVPFLGDGRVAWAPVEDLAFGLALVLATTVLWAWQDRRPRTGAHHSGHADDAGR